MANISCLQQCSRDSKMLVETRDELAERKNKHHVLDHVNHQLTEEVASKEAAVIKEHALYLQILKDRDCLLDETQSLKNQICKCEQVIVFEERCLQKSTFNY